MFWPEGFDWLDIDIEWGVGRKGSEWLEWDHLVRQNKKKNGGMVVKEANKKDPSLLQSIPILPKVTDIKSFLIFLWARSRI